MHTPAPVFEHGAARNKRRASKATKRGGWLHKTLPKTPMGTKRQRKISNLRGNQHSWCQGTKDKGTDMQLKREQIELNAKSRRYMVHSSQGKKTK